MHRVLLATSPSLVVLLGLMAWGAGLALPHWMSVVLLLFALPAVLWLIALVAVRL